MPNNTETPVNDNTIIEITSSVNAAIYSAVNHAIDRAPAPIRAGLFLMEQSGGAFQVIIANEDNRGGEIAEAIVVNDDFRDEYNNFQEAYSNFIR